MSLREGSQIFAAPPQDPLRVSGKHSGPCRKLPLTCGHLAKFAVIMCYVINVNKKLSYR